jgi:hypothetical protein
MFDARFLIGDKSDNQRMRRKADPRPATIKPPPTGVRNRPNSNQAGVISARLQPYQLVFSLDSETTRIRSYREVVSNVDKAYLNQDPQIFWTDRRRFRSLASDITQRPAEMDRLVAI